MRNQYTPFHDCWQQLMARRVPRRHWLLPSCSESKELAFLKFVQCMHMFQLHGLIVCNLSFLKNNYAYNLVGLKICTLIDFISRTYERG
ncbi:hypothetical protein MPTK1_3g00280 [Marchantia polymorpha subsp. ruderalis]|uniref:Uncharacterized protein n=2 Tax=Marchantia polymorpha TaxID=3197 RepID=A0AAF6AVU6_MARPO|nr:hypothetical protein MARPO_0007s0025 [Marchantia polymorpha]BBN03877.1 hypothetical protein Mp_3g00280 [Marchantia polymorpha subsp. ruderalis]PTQ47567.1 hypothetical protein MARPO_0007s0025 [Marchantia polymorpha]PTQ47568.1 hypothetical protein MARPO_0007s0025 [Marchantia polymorpha]PTQ47569.1 hypothetical protein MARPO_0007s0025 [Marchantia polymorpha]|eukprot:PTQ47566.1 hypothetical protein MARPO_0007s0025 [Marchantia polymorpha]